MLFWSPYPARAFTASIIPWHLMLWDVRVLLFITHFTYRSTHRFFSYFSTWSSGISAALQSSWKTISVALKLFDDGDDDEIGYNFMRNSRAHDLQLWPVCCSKLLDVNETKDNSIKLTRVNFRLVAAIRSNIIDLPVAWYCINWVMFQMLRLLIALWHLCKAFSLAR